jgi:hypothetical protein
MISDLVDAYVVSNNPPSKVSQVEGSKLSALFLG